MHKIYFCYLTKTSEILGKMKYIFFLKMIKRLFICFAALTFILIFISVADAEPNLYIPALTVQSGQSIKIPVKIDQIEKLAGVKLVIEYDIKHLMYEKVDKSDKASSLMHVVNDKNPGKLIIVMAGAKGVSGHDFELLTIQFKAASGLKETTFGHVRITEAELVSEDLKTIQCRILENSLDTQPEK